MQSVQLYILQKTPLSAKISSVKIDLADRTLTTDNQEVSWVVLVCSLEIWIYDFENYKLMGTILVFKRCTVE